MITMSEIARLTNVSQPTVSRVLNGNPSVNPEVRERVLACAREHNYQPNALAKGLQGRCTQLLGVLLTDISNGFFAELAKELEACANRAGYSIILLNSGGDPIRERDCIDVVRRYRVDGLVAVPFEPDSPLWAEEIHELDVPVVAVTKRVAGLDSVYVDHAEAGRQAARHLLERGYDNFLFIGCDGDEKGIGFFRELRARGVENGRLLSATPRDREMLFRALDALLPAGGRRTGIFATNDFDALILLDMLRSRGICVPERAGVVGFDDIPVSRFLNPSLTSLSQPLAEMARRAVGQLMKRVESAASCAVIDEPLYASLVARESTGAA